MRLLKLNFVVCLGIIFTPDARGTNTCTPDSLVAEKGLMPLVSLPEASVSVGTMLSSVLRSDAPKATAVLFPGELATAVSLTEALEYVPGVDIQNRGPFGVQSDISIRGGSFDQTALLVNGVRWSAPHTGHHLMNIPIDPEDLGHVEVVRSGSGAMAGTGAFAGSVHLQTRTDEVVDGGSAAVEIGSFGWSRFRLHADIKGEKATQRFSLSRAKTNGYIENSDSEIARAMWVSDWGKESRNWKMILALEDKAFGAQNFYSSNFPDQYETTQAAIAQLNWSKTGTNWRASAAAHGRYHRDRFELFREGTGWYQLTEDSVYVRNPIGGQGEPDTANTWYAGANLHRSMTAALNGKFAWYQDQSILTFSADVREELIQSNRLGVDSLGGDAIMFPLGDRRTNLDALVSWRGDSESGRLMASITAGINANSRFGTQFLPSVDVRYQFGLEEEYVLFGSASRSVRHPTFTDLYYNVGGAQGSEDLLPEFAEQAEIGARWVPKNSKIMVETSGFIRKGKNLIDWIKYDQAVPATNVYQAANLSAIDFWGGDVVGSYRWETGLLKSLRIGYAVIDAKRNFQNDDTFTSIYVLNFIRNKLDVVTDFDLGFGVDGSIRYSVQRRNQPFSQLSEDTKRAFQLLDFSLQRVWGQQQQICSAIRVNNCLDEEYVDISGVLQPGVNVRFSLSFNLNALNQE